MKRSLTVIFAVIFTITLMSASIFAEPVEGEDGILPPNTYMDIEGDEATPLPESARARTTLPTAYSSVDSGVITPVKNQGSFGTCWAFAAIAAAEADAVKNEGAVISDTDLSELHLAYFHYSARKDPLGLLDGDSVASVDASFLQRGGKLISDHAYIGELDWCS